MINTQKISLNDQVVQNEGNIVSDMDGEKVMLNIEKGKYYNLGEIGGVIWTLLEQPVAVSEVITTLISEFEVEQEKCEKQVVSFIETLLKEELIHIHN